MSSFIPGSALGVALASTLLCAPAHAADGFKLRYPLSGTLGGEVLAPIDKPGWFGSAMVTQIRVDKVTDDTGNSRQQPVAGTFATPAPVAGAVRTANFSGSVAIETEQDQTQANLILGYLTQQTWAGGRLSFAVNVPYTTKLERKLALSGATPALGTLQPALTSPPLPPGAAATAQAAAQAGFASGYQANLAAQSAAGTVEMSGIGDVEVGAAWAWQQHQLKVVAGAVLALPTGEYDAASTANIGFGNYYTLRPGVMVAWSPNQTITLAGKASFGISSRNKDNDVRSGNFAGIDAVAMTRTPIGVVGGQFIRVQQVQDDSGGTFGPNRFRANGAGLFYTTLVPVLGAALNLQYMKMIDTRNAMSGSFYQVRLSKQF
ncbi:transporter [Ramlibacter henchirensis]|uniref:transporter n=1 Tax=Ramlibacter henchirensis TaxID=204072 RepID=UPI0014304536|nr:transporter [Ramlibacter henchirensis]